jgi:hypothetical protein
MGGKVIRTCFVSNSSSSSFCVIGTYLTKQEIEDKFSELVKHGIDAYATGKWDDNQRTVELYEGMDLDQYFGEWSKSILVGKDVDGAALPKVVEAAGEVAKVLGVPVDALRLNSWGFYDG